MFRRLADGERIADLERRKLVILADAPELTVTWSRYGAGERGADLHVHREHADAFFLLDGELTFGVGAAGESVRVTAGGLLAAPPGVVHSFNNDSAADATWLNMHVPDSGFAEFLRAARDGRTFSWDSFDPPADGGRPVADAVVSASGGGALPGMRVVDETLDGRREPDASTAVRAFYVVDGELEVTLDGATRSAGSETLVLARQGHVLAGRARLVVIEA